MLFPQIEAIFDNFRFKGIYSFSENTLADLEIAQNSLFWQNGQLGIEHLEGSKKLPREYGICIWEPAQLLLCSQDLERMTKYCLYGTRPPRCQKRS